MKLETMREYLAIARQELGSSKAVQNDDRLYNVLDNLIDVVEGLYARQLTTSEDTE